jgi:ATP-binding cassette subfamily C (CFTR/MRP) protein 1
LFRVLVLENGELKEFDTPSRLLANTSSTFYSLAKESGLV